MSQAKPVYTVGYESVQEPFAQTQYKAVLYADWGRPRRGQPRGPELVIETSYGGSKEAAAVDLAHRALQQGFRPNALPKELAAAVLVASEELIERAEQFLADRFKIRDEALAVLTALKGVSPGR